MPRIGIDLGGTKLEGIVLGGGLSRIESRYRRLPLRAPTHVFPDLLLTRILPPVHGDSSGVRGAAWPWPADA